MEMSGEQKLQLKTKRKSGFYKKLKQDEEK